MGEANFLQVLIAPEYKILGSTGINRDIGYCENSLYDLRIGMQLIALSYYKKKNKKIFRIIKFQPHHSKSSSLFKNGFILKFSDKVNLTLYLSVIFYLF